ncbi:hypothetical protein EXS62_02040 [Candidatus Kaiserbacteria bacterium]|nr:hypothetical protein [Candidatus Kaiserbacteria bacterium]
MHKEYIFIFGGAIGDALLGIHLGQTLAAAAPGSRLTLLSTRKSSFTKQLVDLVPEVAYREMPKDRIGSWLALLGLALSPHGVAYLEPFRDATPLWWRIIARAATLVGGVEVRCQMRDIPAPARVRVIRYDSKTDNLFSMIEGVVGAWGYEAQHAQPSLPAPACTPYQGRPYILFHFFAGTYRRSIPVDHARDLLTAARREYPQHEFILTCAHNEAAAARRIAEGMVDTQVEVSPPASTLLCLLAQASMVVGVASGVTHIAAHLRAPSVVLCNLSDPCWLPTYNPEVVLLAAREECGCNGDKTGECNVETPEGGVYRCLYFIKTSDIISGMRGLLSVAV